MKSVLLIVLLMTLGTYIINSFLMFQSVYSKKLSYRINIWCLFLIGNTISMASLDLGTVAIILVLSATIAVVLDRVGLVIFTIVDNYKEYRREVLIPGNENIYFHTSFWTWLACSYW